MKKGYRSLLFFLVSFAIGIAAHAQGDQPVAEHALLRIQWEFRNFGTEASQVVAQVQVDGIPLNQTEPTLQTRIGVISTRIEPGKHALEFGLFEQTPTGPVPILMENGYPIDCRVHFPKINLQGDKTLSVVLDYVEGCTYRWVKN